MPKKKLTRKDLSAPDAFERTSFTVLEWCKKNAVLLSVLGAAALFVLIGFFTYQYVQTAGNTERKSELAAIDTVYQEETQAISDQQEALFKQTNDLDKKIKDLEAKNKADPVIANLKAEKTKAEQNLKNLLPDHSKSLKMYNDFAAKHADRPTGNLALLKSAMILVKNKKFAQAEPILKKVSESEGGEGFYRLQVGLYHVNVLEELKKFKEALSEVSAMVGKQNPKDEMMPLLLLTKGRLQILSGAKAEAVKTFDQIIENHASSYEASRAKEYKIYASMKG